MVGSTIQHYRIRERLGKGGMGEVYLAEDTRLGREVALKFLPADAQKDAERRARFLTEARAASALRSSNIAAIYDIGQYEGADYIVMEYVEGETLSKRVHKGPLAVREAVDIATQVADALADAHGRGIVHRDIKSANIIVTARGQAKVLDFGLAKFLQPPSGQASVDSALTIGEDTMAGTVLGTASYMSPEQALGRNVDQRSDLFSTGVVFYEMLTAKLPFEGKSFGEVVDAILHYQPQPVARLASGIPGEVDTIIRKALEKNPEVRYQTARDLFSDLQRVKGDLDEVERHGTSIRSSSGNHLHPPVVAPENSIAVVTFTNITREPADEWIGSGIAETVSADLKNVQGLSVIGRERVFDALRNLGTDGARNDDQFAIELGRGLGARWIVSGAFQRLGESIRITARFVEVATGAVLRNVKIDGRLSDIFGLQDRIVFELTQDMNLKLESSVINQIQQPETRSVEAYELYSRGVLTLRMATRDAPDKAIHFFERALALDKDYAEAWAGMGAAYQIKGTFLGLPELLEKALAAADEALARDPKLAEGHAVRGSAQFALGRLEDALHSYGTAIALDPKNARAHAQLARVHWVGRGDLRAGIAELERAVAINPQFGYAHHQLAYLYTELGEYDKAAGAAKKAIELQEQYISGEEGFLVIGAHTRLGYVFYRQGRYDEAVAEYQMELLFMASSDHVLKDRSLVELHQKLGAALMRLGRVEEGRRHLQLAISKYKERVALGEIEPATQYYVAAAYALLDDAEVAMKVLEKSIAKQKWNQPRALRDADFQPLWPAIEAIGAGERSQVGT